MGWRLGGLRRGGDRGVSIRRDAAWRFNGATCSAAGADMRRGLEIVSALQVWLTGSQLKGKAPCRKSRRRHQDGGAVSPCVGEAMILLGCAIQLSPPHLPTPLTPWPPPAALLHPPRSPITWRALIQSQQYSCQSPGEAITHQPRHRKRLIAARTPPADAHVTGRPLHGGVLTHSESTAGFFFPLLMIRTVKRKDSSAPFLPFTTFSFSFLTAVLFHVLFCTGQQTHVPL